MLLKIIDYSEKVSACTLLDQYLQGHFSLYELDSVCFFLHFGPISFLRVLAVIFYIRETEEQYTCGGFSISVKHYKSIVGNAS